MKPVLKPWMRRVLNAVDQNKRGGEYPAVTPEELRRLAQRVRGAVGYHNPVIGARVMISRGIGPEVMFASDAMMLAGELERDGLRADAEVVFQAVLEATRHAEASS